jgi:hypothetical protein
MLKRAARAIPKRKLHSRRSMAATPANASRASLRIVLTFSALRA